MTQSADDLIAELVGPPPATAALPVATPSPELVRTGDGVNAMVGGAFEGASRFDESLATWWPSHASADQDILPVKENLDARVRDTIRNDAYVAGGAQLHKDNIVGSLYMLNAKPMSRILGAGFDDTWEEEFQEEVEAKFTLAGETPDAWLDREGKKTFTEMVRLAVGLYVQSGEVLAISDWETDEMRPFSTAIQFIDLARLSDPGVSTDPKVQTLLMNDRIRGGIEIDDAGRPVAYYIRNRHPTEWRNNQTDSWRRVVAKMRWGRPRVIHILEQERVAQHRGIAAITAALKELRITKRFRDIVLQNAVLNATFAATIESEMDTNAIFARLGGQTAKEWDSAVNNYVGSWMKSIGAYNSGAKGLQLNGVKIPHLPPGTKLNMQPAGSSGPLGSDFEASLLRYIAASLGVSYEQLSRDYTETNYSSARAAMNETWKFMISRKRVVADRFANTVYRLWLEEELNRGRIESMPRAARAASWLYADPYRVAAISQADWIGASRGQIDELKETQAAVLRLKYGLSTHEYEISRLGQDWRRNFRQKSREQRLAESLDITISDPGPDQMNAASGSPRESSTEDQ